MARWWKETYNPQNLEHDDKMWGAGWPYNGTEYALETTSDAGIIPIWVYFVTVCSFTFTFRSLDQLRACQKFYEQKILDSSRIDLGAADNWEVQTWYQRLPLYLREEPKRQKVIKALGHALTEFNKGI